MKQKRINMKKISMVGVVFICTILFGCASQKVADFIPGTYVRTVINEFSVGRDTLVIGSVDRRTYTIIHRGSYRLIKQGKLLPEQSISENWIATYDEDKEVLMESKRGKIISFDTSKNILLVGSSPYEKIK